MVIEVGEQESKVKSFFRKMKEFERKEGILIVVLISVGIFMIIIFFISGIFYSVYGVIEVGPIFIVSLGSSPFFLGIGGIYYRYGPIRSLMNKGVRLQKKGRADLALEYYTKALKIRPASIWVVRRIVSAYNHMGRIDKGIEFCKELISTSVLENAKFYEILSELYVRKKDYSKAKESIEQVLELESDNHKYMLKLAEIHLALDEYESVLNICKIIINNKLEDKGMWNMGTRTKVGALNLITRVYIKQNDREKLLELSKQNSLVLSSLGYLHQEAGEHKKAIEYYRECLKHNKGFGTVWNNLGASYNEIGQFDLAISALQKSIKIRKKLIKDTFMDFMSSGGEINEYKEDALTYNHLGFAYYNLGQYSKALKAVNYSLKLDFKFERAWYTLALIHIKTDRLKEALAACDKALELNQNYKEALGLKEEILKDF